MQFVRRMMRLLVLCGFASVCAGVLAAQVQRAIVTESLSVAGLAAPVEVRRDRWGVPHIYAKNQHDLFLAQGFVAAQDRLWQMDMWRRIGEGRLSEVLGPKHVERDKFARLLKYRGFVTTAA